MRSDGRPSTNEHHPSACLGYHRRQSLLAGSALLVPYQQHMQGATLFLGFQTVAEMRFGALKANWGASRRQVLEQFFSNFNIILYNDALAFHWVEVMLDAQRVGRRLEAGDGWIVAPAKYLNAPLLTHDKDFDPSACPSLTIYRYLPK